MIACCYSDVTALLPPDEGIVSRAKATDVDTILKGATLGDIPVEQFTIIELLIDGKTAEALGRNPTFGRQYLARGRL